MNTLELFGRDPMIGLELCAMFFTLCYVAKLALLESDENRNASTASVKRISEMRFSEDLLRFFAVGSLIPTHKRSLRKQFGLSR